MSDKKDVVSEDQSGVSDSKTEVSKSRRKALNSILVGAGAVGATSEASKWGKPAIDSVVLPSHAEMTAGGGEPGAGTTPMPSPAVSPIPVSPPALSPLPLPSGITDNS